MKESNLNTTIANAFLKLNFGHKISDASPTKKPFDGFAVALNTPFYYESKLVKPLKSFNFNSIEDHQYANLRAIKDNLFSAQSLFFLGAFESRKYYDIYAFDIGLITLLTKNEKNSIIKKELEKIKQEGYTLPVKRENNKYVTDFSSLLEKVVTIDVWNYIFS